MGGYRQHKIKRRKPWQLSACLQTRAKLSCRGSLRSCWLTDELRQVLLPAAMKREHQALQESCCLQVQSREPALLRGSVLLPRLTIHLSVHWQSGCGLVKEILTFLRVLLLFILDSQASGEPQEKDDSTGEDMLKFFSQKCQYFLVCPN